MSSRHPKSPIERTLLLLPIAFVVVATGAAVFATVKLQQIRSGAVASSALTRLAEDAARLTETTPLDPAAANALVKLIEQHDGIARVDIYRGAEASLVQRRGMTYSTPIRLTTGEGMLVIETSEPRAPDRDALYTIAIAAVAAALLAAITSRALLRKRLAPIAAALAQKDYSQRLPQQRGALGRVTDAANELLAEMQVRELALRRRTLELEAANEELEAFTYSVSHDLRAPIGSIDGFSQALEEDYGGGLDALGKECVHWIRDACKQMRELVDGLLQMSRFTRAELEREEVDVSGMARSIADTLRQRDPQRDVTFRIQDGVVANGDPRLLHAVLENLMANAWKFTSKHPKATIELGTVQQNGTKALYVRDDGAGFDPGAVAKIFQAFQRLHSRSEFDGTGIGLATVERILHRHGGKIWAEGEVEKGATFYFTTGKA